MIRAGVSCFHDLAGHEDLEYLVEAIYLAMEYQRRDSLGQLSRLSDQAPQIQNG
jgi:hypothetical protein